MLETLNKTVTIKRLSFTSYLHGSHVHLKEKTTHHRSAKLSVFCNFEILYNKE